MLVPVLDSLLAVDRLVFGVLAVVAVGVVPTLLDEVLVTLFGRT